MADQMITLDDPTDKNPWQEFRNPWTDGTSPPRDVMIEFSIEGSGMLCFAWIAFLSPPPGNEDVREVVWQLAGREYDHRQHLVPGGHMRFPTRWRWPIDPETGRILERKFTEDPRIQELAERARVENRILSTDEIQDIDVETLPAPQSHMMRAANLSGREKPRLYRDSPPRFRSDWRTKSVAVGDI